MFALVTGASSGIGESLARYLSRQGAKVVLLARNIEKLEKIKNEIEKTNSNILIIKCDVRNREMAFENVKKAADYFNGIDILINNAGQGYFGAIETMEPEHINHVFETNISGPINFIQATLPYLKKSKGMIVNINSLAGKIGSDKESAYAASKHAMKGFADSLQFDGVRDGVRILNIYPGAIKTEMTSHKKNAIDPKELADLVVSLCVRYETLRITDVEIKRSKY